MMKPPALKRLRRPPRSKPSLEYSNDQPDAVQIEIWAAAEEPDGSMPPVLRNGFYQHVANQHDNQHDVFPLSFSERTGWLIRELRTHDDRDERDATAWGWDPARPIAGQYEAWAETGVVIHPDNVIAQLGSSAPAIYHPEYQPRDARKFEAMSKMFGSATSVDALRQLMMLYFADMSYDRQDLTVALGRAERANGWRLS